MGKDEYEKAIKKMFGELATECLELYQTDSDDAMGALTKFNLDGNIAFLYFYGKIREESSDKKTYIYNFSRVMPGIESDYICNFAKCGNLNSDNVSVWNNFSKNEISYMSLDTISKMNKFDDRKFRLWSSFFEEIL